MDTYVISLERSTDRREHMLRVMLSAGITFEFWKATDGFKLTSDEIEEYICQDSARKWSSKKRPLSPGEIGCAVSHITLWKHLIATQTPIALILEDDIVFTNGSFTQIVAEVATLISGREVALFNCNVNSTWIFRRIPLKTGGSLCYANGKANLTAAYLVTFEAASALVNRIETYKLGFPIDCWIHQSRKSFERTVRTRVVLPNPVRQIGEFLPSTITQTTRASPKRRVIPLISMVRDALRAVLPPCRLHP